MIPAKKLLLLDVVTLRRAADAGANLGLLNIDESWRPIVQPITHFKDAIDRVREGESAIVDSDRELLKSYGINAAELRALPKGAFDGPARHLTAYPDGLAGFILGTFGGAYSSPTTLAHVPAWATLGWLRKPGYLNASRPTSDEARGRLAKIYRETRRDRKDGTVTCFGGIPLFVCGEGKNRGAFHRDHSFRQLVRIRLAPFPIADHLTLQRVAFHHDLLALHCRTAQGITETALLPFGSLSVPVLESYGVQWRPGVWRGILWPFSVIRTHTKLIQCRAVAGLFTLYSPTRFRRALVMNLRP